MAKTIKFNLICDETPIRTIEDLQEHFCIDDILPYYRKGLLQRWLEIRGYTDYLEKVKAIKAKTPSEIIFALVQIFSIPTNAEQVKADIYLWEFQSQHAAQLQAEAAANVDAQKRVAKYLLGYAECINTLDSAGNNPTYIKPIVAGIIEEYPMALAMCHRALFWKFLKNAPLVIMRLLMDRRSRDYFLPVFQSNQDGTIISDITLQSDNGPQYDKNSPQYDKNEMYQALCKKIKLPEYQEKLGDSLKTFVGVTENGAWKNLVPKGKKVMVISMEGTSLVRSAGVAYGADIGPSKVVNRFPLFDGLDYRCSEPSNKLLYMEV